MRTLLSILALSTLAACKDKGDDSGPTGDGGSADGGSGDGGDSGAADCVEENGACVLSGTYIESLTLTADKPWLLRSAVVIGDESGEPTLTIEAGTQVYGESATNGLLIISRGANIEAVGTADAPIVFTSDQPVGSRARGDWGGLVLNGYGLLNACADGADPCEAEGEGGTGTYGGSDNTDDSGTLQYVVIEFGGTEVSTDNEVNGLGLQGVGSGTTIDFVQIHHTQDDCIEFWGGAVDARHIVCTSPGDDGIDWDLGWTGRMQFAVVQQSLGTGNNGIEADNNPDDYAATPVTAPVVSNFTLVGDVDVKEDNFGALLRRGVAPELHNVAIMGFSTGCLAVRDDETIAGFTSGAAAIQRSVLACASPYEDEDEAPIFTAGSGNAVVADLGLVDPLNTSAPDFRLKSGSVLASGGVAPSDAFFEQVSYIGAFDGSTDWTAGWTRHDAN